MLHRPAGVLVLVYSSLLVCIYVDDGELSCGVVAIVSDLYQLDIDVPVFLNDFLLIRPVLCTILL